MEIYHVYMNVVMIIISEYSKLTYHMWIYFIVIIFNLIKEITFFITFIIKNLWLRHYLIILHGRATYSFFFCINTGKGDEER